MKFKSLIDVTLHFSDKQVCKEYLAKMRWNGEVVCPHCGAKKIYTMKHNYKCAKCRKQFSETKGTIFENSAVTLQKWFVAIWLITSHKKGISSIQLGKDVGVTQKTAWFMLQRIRYAMETQSFEKTNTKMDGIVQIDETYIGGEAKNMHRSKRAKQITETGYVDKTPVLGIINAKEVRAIKLVEADRQSIEDVMKKEICPSSIVVTDGFKAYTWAKKHYSKHVTVSHSQGEYVKDGYHTNSIEGFWSIFKRGIIGIYHSVSDKHLDRYINEFEFRYNRRNLTEVSRFEELLSSLNGKRLMYNELIG